MEAKIKEFFDRLPAKKRELAMKLREIILKSNAAITEDIKWGNLTFVSNGNIAFIYSYDTTDYINLGFSEGTALTDPKGLLEGTDKSMRHVKIRSEKDIDEKQITAWIQEAAKLNQKQTKPAGN